MAITLNANRLRRVLLVASLSALALSAGLGLAGLFMSFVSMSAKEEYWPSLIGTFILTLVTCCLLFWVARLLDRPETRSVGLLAITWVLIEFLLCFLVIG